jgi:hypothetical protein
VIGQVPVCVSCRHFDRDQLTCSAYPDGIPQPILWGFDHRKPFGGEVTRDGEPVLFAQGDGLEDLEERIAEGRYLTKESAE